MTERICSLIEGGLSPEQHLVLTFTRKACDEVRKRVAARIGNHEVSRRIPAENFHTFGYRIIREFPTQCWRSPSPTLADDSDQRSLFRRCGIANGLDLGDERTKRQMKAALRLHSLCKNEGWTAVTDPARTESMLVNEMDTGNGALSKLLKALQMYERELVRLNNVDFDDLCLLPMVAMQESPALAATIAERFPMVTVDEYQDTNRVQYELLKGFAIRHRNVVVVGDDKQGIYGFRGARVENLWLFKSEFGARVAQLGDNFRSRPAIVRLGSNLISYNRNQMPMESRSTRADGAMPKLFRAKDASAGGDLVARWVLHHHAAGVPLSDLAILYRTNRLARMLEPALKAQGVPYDIAGGTSIYRSPELRAAIGAARLMANPADVAALGALSEFIPGLASGSIAKLAEAINSEGGEPSVFAAAACLGPKVGAILSDLEKSLLTLQQFGPAKLGEWVRHIDGLDLDGCFIRRIAKAKTPLDETRRFERCKQNLAAMDLGIQKSLSDAAAVLVPKGGGAAADWNRVLSPQKQWELVLEAAVSEPDPDFDRAGKVRLSTIHRAKGLEWQRVLIVGFSEGLMPMISPEAEVDPDDSEGHEDGGIDEERRLAFVALTRAKDAVDFLHVANLQPFGGRDLELSRFYGEMLKPSDLSNCPRSMATHQSLG